MTNEEKCERAGCSFLTPAGLCEFWNYDRIGSKIHVDKIVRCARRVGFVFGPEGEVLKSIPLPVWADERLAVWYGA